MVAAMAKFNYVSIHLTGDESTPDPAALEHSFLGRGAMKCEMNRYIGELAPDVIRDPSLGNLWSDIPPKDDGSYLVEVGTELPFFLPTLGTKSEYVLRADGTEFFTTLRAARVFFGTGYPKASPTEYFLCHIGAVNGLAATDHGNAGLHVVPIRTFISYRQQVVSESASKAVEDGFISWRSKLILGVAQILDGLRSVAPAEARHLLPQIAAPAFPTIWVMIAGGNPETIGCQQFAGDLGNAAFRSLANLDGDKAERLATHLAAPLHGSTTTSAIGLAHAFCHYGYYDLALLEVCVASESALWQRFERDVLLRGASQNRLDEAKSDITFSQLLNVHLFLMTDMDQLPDWQNLLGRLNWARKRRNEAVHTGRLSQAVSASEVGAAIQAAEKLVAFLGGVL